MIRSALSRGRSLITLNLLYRFPLPPTPKARLSLSFSSTTLSPSALPILLAWWPVGGLLHIGFLLHSYLFFASPTGQSTGGISPRRYSNVRSARIAGPFFVYANARRAYADKLIKILSSRKCLTDQRKNQREST
jgi:hypothetical protein